MKPPAQNPFSSWQGQFISAGTSGLVELLADGRVRKFAWPTDLNGPKDLAFEARVYREIGPHDRILKMLDHDPQRGLYLEYMSNGDLAEYLQRQGPDFSLPLKFRWVCQIAEALEVVHAHHLVHGDLKPKNLLLDDNLNLKLCDFAGSTYDGSMPEACEKIYYRCPRGQKELATPRWDLFALGSVIYEIFKGKPPYNQMEEDEIQRRFTLLDYPQDVSSLLPCEIIKKCWRQEFQAAVDVRTALEEVAQRVQS